MIKKIKSRYFVLSETTGWSFGSYRTLAEAKKRLGQAVSYGYLPLLRYQRRCCDSRVEFFKHRARGAIKSSRKK